MNVLLFTNRFFLLSLSPGNFHLLHRKYTTFLNTCESAVFLNAGEKLWLTAEQARARSHSRPATLRAKNPPNPAECTINRLRTTTTRSRTPTLRHPRITVRCACGTGSPCVESRVFGVISCLNCFPGGRSFDHQPETQVWFFDWFSYMYTSSNPSFHLHFNNHVCTLTPSFLVVKFFFLLFISDYLYKKSGLSSRTVKTPL